MKIEIFILFLIWQLWVIIPMSRYAWPADVAVIDKSVYFHFPDWPDLKIIAHNVPEAMTIASEALDHVVNDKIQANLEIPLPSNLGSRGELIPISDEVAVRLGAYLREKEVGSFRYKAEIEQAGREKRSIFLTEFHTSCDPILRIGDRQDAAATEFALLGVKNCYFLNAGGLVAIPAIMQVLSNKAVPGDILLWPALIFVLGIVMAAITNYLAYRSISIASESWKHELDARSQEVHGIYYPPDNDETHRQTIERHREDHERKVTSARHWANGGLIAFVASVFCFIAGIFIIIFYL